MRLRSFVPAMAGAALLMSPGSAMADDVGQAPGLPDFDVRGGKLAPTAAQKSDVRSLQADVAWNQFGTPSSLVRPAGSLATVGGSSAVDAARA